MGERIALAEEIAREITGGEPVRDRAASIADVAAAYEIQDRVAAELAHQRGPVGGYKIAWNGPGQAAKQHVDAPGTARIFAAEIQSDPGNLGLDGRLSPAIECEIAVRLGADLAGQADWTADAVRPAVAEVMPAFELLDRRGGLATAHGPTALANNVFNIGCVLGAACDPSILDTGDFGETRLDGPGGTLLQAANAVPQPPLDALAHVTTVLTARGLALRAGDVVLCGAHEPVRAVAAGGHYRLTIGALGSVSLTVG
ncbi:hypothetical protein [Oceanomicrobium pacificus]|uniref:2-keto-4-pentenoate hydratase n=1 Tax=Oceanomicrobium pacificus TaxID=2692916 RepID=A0A6B0TMZ8_9RHOB|nr:hypothetical protein [Oceanomicrobium pacificus]MXU65970.1 hypothetical protein [Oceanomicrobium pacificus]